MHKYPHTYYIRLGRPRQLRLSVNNNDTIQPNGL